MAGVTIHTLGIRKIQNTGKVRTGLRNMTFNLWVNFIQIKNNHCRQKAKQNNSQINLRF